VERPDHLWFNGSLLLSSGVILIYITYEILARWVELVLGSETSRLTKTVKIEEFLEDIARVEVLSGWETHYLVLL
jgi:hypothetical protein